MLPILKVFTVNYDFIIKNYLSPEMWEKTWNIFEYKNYIISICLSSIDVRQKAVYFAIKMIDKNNFDYNKNDSIKYILSTDNISILQNQIEGCVFRIIDSFEKQYFIEKSEEYGDFIDVLKNEKDRLQEIAENFLDDNNVSNSEIREAYTEYYINVNEKMYSKLINYTINNKYKHLTDLFLIFAKATENNEKYGIIIEENRNNKKLKQIIKDVEEYMQYMETSDFTEEMQDKLEGI